MLTREDVLAARDRVTRTARHTPLERSYSFSEMTGADVHLKYETVQRTGSFKIRGATNRIATLTEAQQDAGVVAASAGNHAQGVALAASQMGVDSTIVMPERAPVAKVKATRSYGGNVVLHGEDYDAAAEHAHEIADAEDRTYVPAFDDEMVMAGQGTLGLEIEEDCPEVDTVVVAVGGGGLISGVATALKGLSEDVRVIGVQAEGAASLPQSLAAGEIVEREGVDTIADGIATRKVGERTFEVIQRRVDEVVTVPDSAIAVAVTKLLERTKTLVEGGGAVPVAALFENAFEYEAGETIVPVLSGGNVDLNVLTTMIMRGLIETGRYLRIRTVLEDHPGALEDLVEIISAQQGNIYAIEHDRASRDIAMDDTVVDLDIETRGPEHVETLLGTLRENGYAVDVLV
ncbi:threonine ammonia-lyase [Halorhabdus sp. CBA1104]|uniref:threonine ammonia-lyase n=1 Tax=unclassified Halorhabdus TaxID=2621901 RepID=UPI0012B19E20|nr:MULTISPECIES: threonine ammonia-lyase [unclassified Halorhabdus]QGN08053.1 threonine ammonia-lyase [Halorhabdus sp. CBA1104]